ncbi:mitochondrial translation elongation factor G [Heterostelium album PN500]|uniref:Mitochondrial translation elongation factor G n=1 Tax=Heterostelium pallidum (strain ATCC 26659 / Pp 5 / PN500) TaxID=670386 RepID=D3BNW4_HETP5|nr:mitochondrial translation elongation factor G [Heterostelium album PN500]EFA76883.1 mitochondrial translation elongation factor G [Heterostelium album PN500]|eukprot:XP_020429015.1 mitochondrial translation elongation factor G [Heterostelium album PN500]
MLSLNRLTTTIQRNSHFIRQSSTCLVDHLKYHNITSIYNENGLRSYSSSTSSSTKKKYSSELNKYRNIGIIAHVDAGKTTTCERMLYYSGMIKRIGEVHKGDTVMDHLKMERERGITITAATITFPWKENRINLVDTPGHVDFTVEVERSVRVMDGAVAIFDAVAGVQAQSITVWNQAERYRVPRVAFVNKMDREGATADKTLKMLKSRLNALPLPLQMPIDVGPMFGSVVDLIKMNVIGWSGEKGELVETTELRDYPEEIVSRAQQEREHLITTLADIDEDAMQEFLETDGQLSDESIRAAIRRVTIGMKAIPILYGSSLKNKGVQQLLDSIVEYLPSPIDREPPSATDMSTQKPMTITPSTKEPLCALAFKVVHDKRRGLIVFTRVYSGVLKAGTVVYNSRKAGEKERVQKLLQVAADDMEEIQELRAGDIGAVLGLKGVCTGDTLVYEAPSDKGLKPVLKGIVNPPPVFFCALEPDTEKDYQPLIEALETIQKEDPSFLYQITESQQILISGMGELHLEIIKDRLDNHFKVGCRMGRMQVSYKGTIDESIREDDIFESFDVQTSTGPKTYCAGLSLTLEPTEPGTGTEVKFDLDDQTLNSIDKSVLDKLKLAIVEGGESAFQRGLPLGFPATDLRLTVHRIDYRSDNDSPPLAFRNCVIRSVMKMGDQAGSVILEPMMNLEISVDEKYLGSVLSDLSRQRRGTIKEVGMEKNTHIISALVPLKEMIGYSTQLRSVTHGNASFTMEYSHNGRVNSNEVEKILKEIRGY